MAAHLSPAPAPSTAATAPRLSLGMRTVLGFLHAGALFRGPGGSWRSRAFPQERILDRTVRALEALGLAQLREYTGLHDVRRCCAVITSAGMQRHRGNLADRRRPPPPQTEGLLHEVEQLEAEIGERQTKLDKALAAIDAEVRETRAAALRIENRAKAIEARAARLDTEREQIATSRASLRAVTAHACQRLGDEMVRASP